MIIFENIFVRNLPFEGKLKRLYAVCTDKTAIITFIILNKSYILALSSPIGTNIYILSSHEITKLPHGKPFKKLIHPQLLQIPLTWTDVTSIFANSILGSTN